MFNVLESYTTTDLIWIAVALGFLGMSKGGFPIGSLALPVLVLIWPSELEPAKNAVSFMLPMLCLMDIVAVTFYRRHIQWPRIGRLMPGTLAGVAVGSLLFVSKENAIVVVPDKVLKLVIGLIGLCFVMYRLFQARILKQLSSRPIPSRTTANLFGVAAGLSSTLAHAGGPIMQMYLLPQRLPKMQFAATTAAFFWILNLVKMVPFLWHGRIEVANLQLGAVLSPVIPVGVMLGYGLVRLIPAAYYVGLIYTLLAATSALLVVKGLT